MKKLFLVVMILCSLCLVSCGKSSEEKAKMLKESEEVKSSCDYACYSAGNTRTSAATGRIQECLSNCEQAAMSRKIEIEKIK